MIVNISKEVSLSSDLSRLVYEHHNLAKEDFDGEDTYRTTKVKKNKTDDDLYAEAIAELNREFSAGQVTL